MKPQVKQLSYMYCVKGNNSILMKIEKFTKTLKQENLETDIYCLTSTLTATKLYRWELLYSHFFIFDSTTTFDLTEWV